MLIAITTITSDKQWRDFCFQSQDLEQVFALLLLISQSEDSIVEARLINQKRSEMLPLDFLDQAPVCNPINQLREQWEKALALPPTENKPALPEWIEYRLGIQQQHIHHLLEVISYTQELVQMTQETIEEGPRKMRLLAHYQRIMDRCSRAVVRLETTPSVVNRYLQKASFR